MYTNTCEFNVLTCTVPQSLTFVSVCTPVDPKCTHDSFPLEVVKAKITARVEQEGVLSVEAGETLMVLEKKEMFWRVKRMENDEEGLVPAFCMPSESPTETSTVAMSGRYLLVL